MGMFDHVVFEDEIDLPRLPDDIDPSELRFQTKEFRKAMDTYKVTEDGRLLREDYHTEEVPKEERPGWDEEEEEFEDEWMEFAGSMQKVTDGWDEIDFHGIMRVITLGNKYNNLPDGSTIEYEVKFTDGELEEITPTDKFDLTLDEDRFVSDPTDLLDNE